MYNKLSKTNTIMMQKIETKISSNRNFGLVFFTVFLILSIWPLMYEDPIRVWSFLISIVFLILGLMNSKILTPLNQFWFKFGMLLGSIISPIVMVVVFFIVVTPIGLFMKIMNKDLLNKKYDKKKITYWIKHDKPTGTMKKQF